MGYSTLCKSGAAVVTCESLKDPNAKPSHHQLQIFDLEDLELATTGFSGEALLGKGSYGRVYKGVLKNGMEVAVKRPSSSRRCQDNGAFENEIRILSKLRGSPHLVHLLGFCLDGNEKLLVVEFMPNGTLHNMLHTNKVGAPLVSWSMRIHIALQVAKAVRDLHTAEPPIIHRDIKSSNILIDGNRNARLGDFGLALRGYNGCQRQRRIPPAGTLGYLDPEYTTPDMLSTKIDVFSFGILLLEIMSGRNAIDVRYNPPSILDWSLPLIKAGKAAAICDPRVPLPRSKSAIKELALVATWCVRKKNSRRPSMDHVIAHLLKIRKRLLFPPLLNITRATEKQRPSLEKAGARPSLSISRSNPMRQRVYAEGFGSGCLQDLAASEPIDPRRVGRRVLAPRSSGKNRRKNLIDFLVTDSSHNKTAHWRALASTSSGHKSGGKTFPRKSDTGLEEAIVAHNFVGSATEASNNPSMPWR